MSRVWHTSDTHFDHKLVAELRGFTKPGVDEHGTPVLVGDTARHDTEIIRRWNATVAHGDTVWHHGDVGMGHYPRFADQLGQLHGTIHLLTGNHDNPFPGNRDSWKYQPYWLTTGGGRFASVQAFARRRVDKRIFLMSHFPYKGDSLDLDRYDQYRLRDEGMWLLHGHIHKTDRITGPHMLHVGLDAWDLAPVSQEQVMTEMIEAEKNGQ
jgi:calcineurin-like phosphoesterase family protein